MHCHVRAAEVPVEEVADLHAGSVMSARRVEGGVHAAGPRLAL